MNDAIRQALDDYAKANRDLGYGVSIGDVKRIRARIEALIIAHPKGAQMIKANGSEFCSWCYLGTHKGEDLLEGSAGCPDDAGALYHGECYSALNRAEGGEFDDADHERTFRKWQATHR